MRAAVFKLMLDSRGASGCLPAGNLFHLFQDQCKGEDQGAFGTQVVFKLTNGPDQQDYLAVEEKNQSFALLTDEHILMLWHIQWNYAEKRTGHARG